MQALLIMSILWLTSEIYVYSATFAAAPTASVSTQLTTTGKYTDYSCICTDTGHSQLGI